MKRLVSLTVLFALVPACACASDLTFWRAMPDGPAGVCQAKTHVTVSPEQRSDNADENSYVPSDSELASYRSALTFNRHFGRYVTGRVCGSSHTTDDLIELFSWKWGIPTNVIRAQAQQESYWHMSQVGDNGESLGIMQIRWTPSNSPHPGTEPLRWKSTAFNLDYYGATLRYYFGGWCSWCSFDYAGDQWNSVGAWFNPTGSHSSYVSEVQQKVQAHAWTSPSF